MKSFFDAENGGNSIFSGKSFLRLKTLAVDCRHPAKFEFKISGPDLVMTLSYNQFKIWNFFLTSFRNSKNDLFMELTLNRKESI